MNLFNKKTLERHIFAAPLRADHLAVLQGWSRPDHTGADT